MDPFTIDYIIDYFGRFMTKKEGIAWKHYTTISSMGKSLQKNDDTYKRYSEMGWLTYDDEALELLKDGWLPFRERTAERILKENAEKIYFNTCPKCRKLARTPVAKQCRFCSYNWHGAVAAIFQAEAAFNVTGRGCYVVGDILNGKIKMGMKLDLVPLHLPKQVEISEVTMGRRGDDRPDFVGLGLKGLSEDELQYLKSEAPFKAILYVERKFKLSYMGMFLSMAGIIGKSHEEVVTSLTKYAKSTGGGFEKATLTADDNNFCVISETNNNTSLLYPNWLLDWDELSHFLSKDLNAPVFSFHIHDGDLWMYVLFVNGETVDQFNPIPEYWDDNISEKEMSSWKGNADIVSKYVRHVNKADIEKYLVHWDLEAEPGKAYPDDVYVNEDWQLLDFLRKLDLPYPLTDDREPVGQVYKFWGQERFIANTEARPEPDSKQIDKDSKKAWWKFW